VAGRWKTWQSHILGSTEHEHPDSPLRSAEVGRVHHAKRRRVPDVFERLSYQVDGLAWHAARPAGGNEAAYIFEQDQLRSQICGNANELAE
jgi:hypothetical protein